MLCPLTNTVSICGPACGAHTQMLIFADPGPDGNSRGGSGSRGDPMDTRSSSPALKRGRWAKGPPLVSASPQPTHALGLRAGGSSEEEGEEPTQNASCRRSAGSGAGSLSGWMGGPPDAQGRGSGGGGGAEEVGGPCMLLPRAVGPGGPCMLCLMWVAHACRPPEQQWCPCAWLDTPAGELSRVSMGSDVGGRATGVGVKERTSGMSPCSCASC